MYIVDCVRINIMTQNQCPKRKNQYILNAATVLDIIGHIEAQTDYLFVYDKTEIDVNRKVNIKAKDQTVAAVLSSLFDNTNTVYAMEGTNILLMSRPEGIQQQNVVTGAIVDETGEGLPGVNVTVKGTMIGVMTDIDGKYSINIRQLSYSSILFYRLYASRSNRWNRNVINKHLSKMFRFLRRLCNRLWSTEEKRHNRLHLTSKSHEIMNRTISQG